MTNKLNQFIDITTSTDYTSEKMTPRGSTYSVQLNMTGTFVASVELQASLDGENWATVTGITATGLTSSDSPVFMEVTDRNHRFSRVVVTLTSGTATIEGFFS